VMKLKISFLLTFISAFIGSLAQFCFAQQADSYVFSTNRNSSLITLTNSRRLLTVGTTNISTTLVPIGFEFWFMGRRFTTFSINANGAIQLGEVILSVGNAYNIANAPRIIAFSAGERNATTGANIGDWRVSLNNGLIHSQVFGNAPNRTLVIECRNMNVNFQSNTNDATFQIILYETAPLPNADNRGGRIEFRYGQIQTTYDMNSLRVGFGFGEKNNEFKGVDLSNEPPLARIGNDAIENRFNKGVIGILSGDSDGGRRVIAFEPPYPTAQAINLRTACTGTDGEIKLDWENTASNAVGSVLYRSTDGNNFTFLTQTPKGTNTFTDKGLVTGQTYFYRAYSVTEGKLCDLNPTAQTSVTFTTPPRLNLGADRTACRGANTTLDGGAGFIGYEWSNGARTQTIQVSPIQTTSYVLTVTDNQCRTQRDTIRITVRNTFSITLDDIPAVCEGDSAIFQAPNGFIAYQWQELGTNRTGNGRAFRVTSTNNVVLTVRNQEGCTAADTAKVLQIIPRRTIKVEGNPVLCNGFAPLTAEQGFDLYEWFDNAGNLIRSDTTPNINISQAGKYSVRATLKSINCSARGEVTVTDCCAPVLDIPNAFTPHTTPSNNIFRVKHENVKEFKMQIYDRWGVLVFLTTDPEDGWNGNALGRPCESGVYQVVIDYTGCQDGRTVRKRKQEVLNLLE
jgi:gliding motility-associated-like protein